MRREGPLIGWVVCQMEAEVLSPEMQPYREEILRPLEEDLWHPEEDLWRQEDRRGEGRDRGDLRLGDLLVEDHQDLWVELPVAVLF